MRVLFLLVCCLAAVSANLAGSQRIVGGYITTIDQYPSIAALLQTDDYVNYMQVCGGSILNQRSVLTAAHCFTWNEPARYRFRVGSTWGNSGGSVHNVDSIIMHPNWNIRLLDSDIAIIRSASTIVYSNVVQAASIPGPNYIVNDNQVVWAAGWGATDATATTFSEQLRHVQLFKISQAVCVQQYGSVITDNMFCAGIPNVGGQSTCQRDSGGPLYHQGTVVGITSFGGIICGDPERFGVYVQVNRFTTWITDNA